MKCPHCDYTVVYWEEYWEDVPEHGEFWELPVEMQRKAEGWVDQHTTLYACPCCKKTFITF